MKINGCFVICTEAGFLEQQSLLLCQSIRDLSGSFKNLPIISFSPRRKFLPTNSTFKKLEKLDVQINTWELNKKYRNYPLANKILALKHVEEKLKYDQIIFLDSDTVILGEPTKINLPLGFDIGLCPERGYINIASSGPGDENEEYWQKIYKLCKVEREMFLKPKTEYPLHKYIRAYWNSGVISAKSNSKIFSRWLENFERVYGKYDFHNKQRYFLEQSVLSATVLAENLKVLQLPLSYNCPPVYIENVPRSIKLKSVKILHYHALFDSSLPQLNQFFKKRQSRQSDWLKKNLRYLNIFHSVENHPT